MWLAGSRLPLYVWYWQWRDRGAVEAR